MTYKTPIDIFLSHSDKDKKVATILKEKLEKLGVKVFLAHVDLDGGTDWNQELFNNIEKSSLFMVLLSKNFPLAKFTDQEVGIALQLGKQILPISIDDTKPYGFLKKFQCKKYNPKFKQSDINKIHENYKNLTRQTNSILDPIIEQLESAESYVEAHSFAKMILDSGQTLSEQQVNTIAKAYFENKEIYQSYKAAPIVLKILQNNKDKVNTVLRDKLSL